MSTKPKNPVWEGFQIILIHTHGSRTFETHFIPPSQGMNEQKTSNANHHNLSNTPPITTNSTNMSTQKAHKHIYGKLMWVGRLQEAWVTHQANILAHMANVLSLLQINYFLTCSYKLNLPIIHKTHQTHILQGIFCISIESCVSVVLCCVGCEDKDQQQANSCMVVRRLFFCRRWRLYGMFICLRWCNQDKGGRYVICLFYKYRNIWWV